MTLLESYSNFTTQLQTIYDERETANITDWVFEKIANIKRIDRITNKEKELDSNVIYELDKALQQLLQHTPVQYILGEAWFYKMKFKVNDHVLIPRPETEELVAWIVEEYKTKNEKFKILDIGTGSGCIAIALMKELNNAEITAIDVSENALGVAKQNAHDQNVKIEFAEIDFLNESSWVSLSSLDIIVSNPPYIPVEEKIKLDKNVSEHEPHIALFVPDNDPFIFYKKIASFAQDRLKENGEIFVELHEDYATKTADIFRDKKFIAEIKKDIYGRERMIKAYREN